MRLTLVGLRAFRLKRDRRFNSPNHPGPACFCCWRRIQFDCSPNCIRATWEPIVSPIQIGRCLERYSETSSWGFDDFRGYADCQRYQRYQRYQRSAGRRILRNFDRGTEKELVATIQIKSIHQSFRFLRLDIAGFGCHAIDTGLKFMDWKRSDQI